MRTILTLVALTLVASSAEAQYNCREIGIDANGKVLICSMIIREKGDVPEIVFERTGPDNALETDEPTEVVGDKVTTGIIYSRTPTRFQNGKLDFDAIEPDGKPCPGRAQQITLATDGAQTETSRPGSIALATTPAGGCRPVNRLVLESDGTMDISGQQVYQLFSGRLNFCGMIKVMISYGGIRMPAYIPLSMETCPRN